MKLLRNALAVAMALVCALGVQPLAAANLVTRDAANTTHYLCAKTQNGIEYPCEAIYGQKADGTLVALPIDTNGNLLTSQAFVLTTPASISATTSSSRVALPAGTNYVLTNRSSTVDLFYALGSSSVSATTSSFVLQAGRSIVVSPGTATYIAAITGSSTATLDITGGYGSPVISGGGGGGGGSGGDASAANQTAVQATAGSDASKAVAVQGITGGKAVPVSVADGIDVAQGATTDSACATDNGNCSVTALLKRNNQRESSLITALGSPFQAGGSIGNTSFGATQSGTWNITNVSGAVSLPTGAATAANQTATQGSKGAGSAATNSDLIGAVYNTSLPTLTNGQQAAAQADSSGRLYVNVGVSALPSGAATDSSLTAVQAIIGAATAPAKMGVIGGVYVSSAPTLSTGQSFAARMDSHGSLVVTCANADGTLCGDISTVKTDQTTHGTTDLVAADITKVGGSAAATDVGPSAATALRVTPSMFGTTYAVNVSTATTTQIIALTSSKRIWVTSWDLFAGGTGNATWVYGTGSNCGTGTTSLSGAYNLTAQAGIAKGSGVGAILTIPSGNALCLTTSAAVQISGTVQAITEP